MALALAVTAIGFAKVTSSRVSADFTTAPAAVEKIASHPVISFRLVLSAAATEVMIQTASQVRPTLSESRIFGTLEIDAANPVLALVIRWKNPTAHGEHRFAKLTLEAPGQATFSHVFDAEGDIDDFLELPFPLTK